MAPGWTSSQQRSSQAKKQQSISSFFTPKATPAPKATSPPETAEEPGTANADSLFLSSEEEAGVVGRRASQKLKRVLDQDAKDIENDVPDPKRLRKAIEDVEEGHLASDEEQRQEQLGEQLEEETYVLQERRKSSGTRAEGSGNGGKKSQLSKRTSKYLFSSSGVEDEGEPDDDARRKKEKLHERFVKKLGRPDSIAEIKRRNHFIVEEAGDAEQEDGDVEEEEEDPSPPKAVAKGRKTAATKKGSSKLTPMEKQVIEIKRSHMDTLLVVEVGYKFRFFGEDARIAAKELGIVCIPGKFRYDEHPSEAHIDRFASASVPVHRLHVHVKRLVAAGHKVGVVRQLETAALKAAGDNRNAPFIRKLTNIYTKGTYIDDVEGLQGPVVGPSGGASASGYLLCLTESNAKGWGNDERVQVGILAVQPATGDIIYDDFEDGFMRNEIETRLLHIAPCEFLIVGDLSRATDKLIQHLTGSKSNVFGDRARVERVEKAKTMAAQAYSHVSSFYAGKTKFSSEVGESEAAGNILDKAHTLSEHVTICLSAMITHLTEYGLEHVFDLTKYFQPFNARSHMMLNGNTLTSLEIYLNQTDGSEKSSLFWTLDRTRTRFGRRLLRKWVGRPLLSRPMLEERIHAVEELMSGGERMVSTEKLKRLLSQVKGDLERSLIRIYYLKCGRTELLNFLQTMQRIANEFAHVRSPQDAGYTSSTINNAIAALPSVAEDVLEYLEKINVQGAKADDKYTFFREEHETDAISEQKLGIASVEVELKEHRAVAAQKLRKSKVDYVTVAGIEYLIEVENSQLKNVPASWAKISGTKKVSRFHTPEVTRLVRERDQHKEALAAACDSAFTALLTDVATKYQNFRDCIQSMATLDCLLSLADIANQPGFVKPEFTDDICINVKQGRHPMVEQLLLDSYIPNDINLSSDDTRALLITGPNMGGKSSYVRQVALISIMAQIGSYVPAASAKLGLLDAVYTRMGAFDNMMSGESTFMVELSETSDILKQATPRSLVVLDELGRGTSTHDGVAIAEAVLDYMLRDLGSLTLFITHYQNLSALARNFEDGRLRNVHMKFAEGGDAKQEITFLYEIGEGVAHRSYGLNVARLAKVPESVIEVASMKSKELEDAMTRKKLASISPLVSGLLESEDSTALEKLVTEIEQL